MVGSFPGTKAVGELSNEGTGGVLFGLQSGRASGAVLFGGRCYYVLEIEDQWYGPGNSYFKVRADDENFYILRYAWGEEPAGWFLDAYRQA